MQATIELAPMTYNLLPAISRKTQGGKQFVNVGGVWREVKFKAAERRIDMGSRGDNNKNLGGPHLRGA